MLPKPFYLTFLICFIGCISQDPSPPLSPDQELATFELDDQLKVELVASEPMVQDPIAISFDEDGKMWVVEMRNFMPDIEGNREDLPIGRISVLIDENQDGQMDKNYIFLDSLILPRAIACTQGGVLVAENRPLWFAKDTNGDFRADIKLLVDSTYGGRGLVEHSPNGLWRGIDNWFYNAKSDFRYRYKNGEWIKEPTEFRGQWGISHDDEGRLFYNYNWSQLHADLVPPNFITRNAHHTPTTGIDHGLTLNRNIYPIRSNTAVNRGYVPGTLDKDGQLLEFASACAPFVYRGHIFPGDFQGNAFVCEPTANLIKRNIITESPFSLQAQEAYTNREFLASTDERFRPVFLASGPDGALYIVDMYKGIVQDGAYMTPYLRKETLDRKLDQPIHMGRIWRVVAPESKTSPKEKMSRMPSDQLIDYLSHPNGWHRDIAQRILVERKDTNILPQLSTIVQNHENSLGRLHALWTLEGLETSSPAIYLEALTDSDPHIQNTAIRILHAFAQTRPEVISQLESYLIRIWPTAPPEVKLHIALVSDHFSLQNALPILGDLLNNFPEEPLTRDIVMSALSNREYAMFQYLFSQSENPQHGIFIEMLSRAITNKGDGKDLENILAKINIPIDDFGWKESAILNGIINHERDEKASTISLTSEPEILKDLSLIPEDIQRSLSALNDIFIWPGKKSTQSATPDILDKKIDQSILALGRQQYLTVCASCHGTDGKGMKRFAPPLARSEWVLGEEQRLILLVLQGMQGPVEVNNKVYDVPDILPEMPSFSTLDNNDLAAIMTYIRNAWGNQASPVQASNVGHIRYRSQGKITPWTAEELKVASIEEIQ